MLLKRAAAHVEVTQSRIAVWAMVGNCAGFNGRQNICAGGVLLVGKVL